MQSYRRQLHSTLKLSLELMNRSTQVMPLSDFQTQFIATVMAECFVKLPQIQHVILGVIQIDQVVGLYSCCLQAQHFCRMVG